MRRALLLIALLPAAGHAADDILIADFEGNTYGNWKTTGEAFGTGPARGTLPGQMPVSGFLGKGLVNSFFKGDGTTGTLTSPPIQVERPYINFLIGGGGYPNETCINLRLGDKVVRTATGPNREPGGSEELDWHSWDVRDVVGKSVIIEIVDRRTGGWGHINVDHIVQSDKPRQSGPASREITVGTQYLHLPVKTGAKMRRMKYVVDGKTVREFDIELADDPGFYAFSDVSAFRGQKLTVEVAKLPQESQALAKIAASDELPDAKNLYKEKHRPQFHFTSRRGWLNDPNGLVYHNGEYHLYYQHNPYGWPWGNMHWGHAVSKDLVRWKELPVALYPPRYGDWCFSGSAYSHGNRLLAAFTSTGRGECLVESTDNGRTWAELPGNPAVKHQGRDPKLFWHEPTKRWVMAVYDELQGKQWIAFYTSADLKAWQFESRNEGFFECPDLFELPVAGDPKTAKWVMYAADGKYVLGAFDGRKFTVESGKHQLWHGNFYAAQTYNNAPNGRRIQIGWNNAAAFPGMPFNQQMTIPAELTLRPTPDGVRLFAEPVKELDTLAGRRHDRSGAELKPNANALADITGELFDILADIEVGKAEALGLTVRSVQIIYDARSQTLSCGKVKAKVAPIHGRLKLRVLADRGSIEVFANDGQVAISVAAVREQERQDLTLAVIAGGAARARALTVTELKSAWE